MTLTDGSNYDSRKKIEAYLSRLRVGLRGIKDQEVREIVEELRSHILDKSTANKDGGAEISASGVDNALAALGSPEELASQYLTDHLLAGAEISRSPLQVVKSSFRWASLSVAGFFVLLGSLLGYFFGAIFILVALLKPFHPHSAGLWTFPDGAGDVEISFRLGFGSVPSGSRDLLGWWIVPIGLAVGCALVMLTTHIAVWFARQYRRSLVLPQL
jgi:uncharacterized membrane protein